MQESSIVFGHSNEKSDTLSFTVWEFGNGFWFSKTSFPFEICMLQDFLWKKNASIGGILTANESPEDVTTLRN